MNPLTLLILIECATCHKPGVNISSVIWYSPSSVDTRQQLRAEGLIDDDNRTTPKGLKWFDQILAVPVPSDEEAEVGDGGPAFPEAIAVGPAGDVYPGMGGMSPRDWFAGQALSGLASATTSAGVWTGVGAEEEAAKNAYRFADAMLAAREAQP